MTVEWLRKSKLLDSRRKFFLLAHAYQLSDENELNSVTQKNECLVTENN